MRWPWKVRRQRVPVPGPVRGARPELCDACGAVVGDGSEQYATVPDSSAVHPRFPLLDGQRRIVACGPGHLDDLVRYYRTRPYDDEELWACQLARAGRTTGDDDLERLAIVAGLTVEQALRATRWRSVWMRWQPEPADAER
jgi:hypothetical protein